MWQNCGSTHEWADQRKKVCDMRAPGQHSRNDCRVIHCTRTMYEWRRLCTAHANACWLALSPACSELLNWARAARSWRPRAGLHAGFCCLPLMPGRQLRVCQMVGWLGMPPSAGLLLMGSTCMVVLPVPVQLAVRLLQWLLACTSVACGCLSNGVW